MISADCGKVVTEISQIEPEFRDWKQTMWLRFKSPAKIKGRKKDHEDLAELPENRRTRLTWAWFPGKTGHVWTLEYVTRIKCHYDLWHLQFQSPAWKTSQWREATMAWTIHKILAPSPWPSHLKSMTRSWETSPSRGHRKTSGKSHRCVDWSCYVYYLFASKCCDRPLLGNRFPFNRSYH